MLHKRDMLLVFLILAVLIAPFESVRASNVLSPDQSSNILITELQTGGISQETIEKPKDEFVELYNNGSTPVDLSGWRVDFLTQNHDGVSEPTRVLAELNGDLEPNEYLLVSYDDYLTTADYYFTGGPASGYLPKGHGTVRLVDDGGDIIDMLGWGQPNNYLGYAADAPEPGYSLQRCVDSDGNLNVTDNNSQDFTPYNQLTPGDIFQCPEPEEPDQEKPIVTDEISCEGIIISELLPNPEGANAGKMFVELHNPTADYISLEGCSLQTESVNQAYIFSDIELKPDQYKAFYDSQTGINLPTAPGGTVYLVSLANEELQSVPYPGGLSHDVSWSWFEGEADTEKWQETYAVTPNAPNESLDLRPCPNSNQERNPETNRCRTITESDQELKPCAENQDRNPETNRCRLISSSQSSLTPCRPGQERNPETNRCRGVTANQSSLVPCREGQERNPETNRCRSINASQSNLVPCRPGQERNPATNRCRAVNGASSQLKPCAPGQERNPETNRCRKSASGAQVDDAEVRDVKTEYTTSTPSWWFAGFAATAAGGYGIWEWRSELKGVFSKLRNRVVKR